MTFYAVPAEIRFQAKVVRSGDCDIWTAGVDQDGYGRFWWNGRSKSAYYWSWEQVHGRVPKGLQLDHLCRNRRCVKVEHLELVTCRENLFRSPFTWASVNASKTHCPRNHEYTPENVYRPPHGGRTCRECERARCRRYYQRRKAQAA